MLAALYIFANLLRVTTGLCFTAGAWDSVRSLVGDIISTPSLAECQDACLQNDQCAAASYSSVSTCALLGADTGKAFQCTSSGTLYVRDPGCAAATTVATSTSAAAETTIAGTSACPTPAWIDPECNTQLHICTQPTVEDGSLVCPIGAGLVLTVADTESGPWICSDGQWMSGGSVMDPTTAVFCKTCADAVLNPYGYTDAGVLPVRTSDGLRYTCTSPLVLWLAYHPNPDDYNEYYYRRTTDFVCQPETGYYWNTPGDLDQGPEPTSMIKDWVYGGDSYDIGCAESRYYPIESGSCENVPDFMRAGRGGVSSIQTHGTCVKIYKGDNCSGQWATVSPGTSSHNDLRKIGFHDNTKSVGPC